MKFSKTTLSQFGSLFILFIIFSFLNLGAQQLAFPTAKGAGAYATGGRGGQVIHVTTLDWDGQGGLKEAIQTPGPRIIVFDVSGEIDASSESIFTPIIQGSAYDNITIAGQTAPLGGITLRVSEFMFQNVDNIVIRYVRFREMLNGTQDPMWFIATSNVILDHCTFSHGADEGADLSASSGVMGDVTVQNCFFQDSKTGTILGIDDVDGDFTFINNAYSNISHRFPNPKGEGHYDIINNIVYNWKNRLIRITGGGTYNVISNYYKASLNGLRQEEWFGDGYITWLQKVQTQSYDNPLIYSSGSIVVGQRDTPLSDDSDMWSNFAGSHLTVGAQSPSQYFTSTQFQTVGAPYEIKSADQAYIDVLNDVGANKTLNGDGSIINYSDSKDTADILMMQNDTYNGSFFDGRGSIPYPTIPQNIRPNNYDSNNDGMPDVWKIAKGFGVNDDLSSYVWPSGYVGVEEYINQIDVDTDDIEIIDITNVEVTPETTSIYVQDVLELGLALFPENATNTSGTWSSSDASIASINSEGLVTAISPGVVIMTFTSYNGFTDFSEITVLPEALQASAGTDQQICIGDSTILTASGGVNYMWNTGETTNSIEVTPNVTTTYTVTVSDDYGQSEDAMVVVTVNAIPTADVVGDQTICLGEFVTLTANGGSSFLWSTGETTASIQVNPIVQTTYTVEVIENNCSSSAEVTVFINDLPNISVSEEIVIVEGESAILTASDSDNYIWSTGETTESITVIPSETTIYSVSTTGANGCINSVDVTVIVVPEIIADAGEDVTICSGDSVNLSASGGLSYSWDTGEVDSELTVAPTVTTTYTVTAQDEYGYTDTDTVTVFVNELPDLVVDDNIFIMIGSSATLTVSGANSYLWNTGEITSEITVTPNVTTTYSVIGESIDGCQNTAEIQVTVIEVLDADAGEDITICLGDSVTLSATGGISFTWNTGDIGASPTFTPTETTTYSVTVTDDIGNSETDSVTVFVNPIPTAYAGEDQTTCQNEAVTLTATQVDGDSFLWSTGETTESIVVNPSEDTIYTVEVSNSTCSHSDDVTVFVMPAPEVTITDDIVIMSGNSATLEVTGGDSYLWNTGEVTNSIIVSPLETSTYTVTTFLENGCQNISQVLVTVVPLVYADAGIDVEVCSGESISLNASGSTNYLWDTGQTSASITITPTETTTYTVTVFDNYGNSESDSVTVTVNELPTITVSENITIFEGQSTDLSVNGAETYLWSTGETTNTISVSPLELTTYTVTGYSTNGCQTIAEIIVTVIPEVIADAGEDIAICIGESVTLAATGSTYFSWNTGQTIPSFAVTPTETTTYTVTVSDDYGNSDTDSVTVTVNELPNLNLTSDSVIVEGESIDLVVSGAETYIWSTGATTNSISVSPLETTVYEVIGTSVSGCQTTNNVTVTVIPEVIANAGNDVTICYGDSITLSASGSSNFSWNTGQTTASIIMTPSETTTYTVTVYDDYGHSDTDSVTVTVNELPDLFVSDDVTIFLGENANLSASGSNSYLWNTGETTNSITVSPEETTIYLVNGFSNNGCHVLEEITVTVIPELIANAGIDTSICSNESITLNASGGSSYLWSTGHTSASVTLSPTETTTYTVTAFDDFGNSDSDSITVTVADIPELTVSDDITIIAGESTSLTANGADVYIWSTGDSAYTIVVSPNETTTYTVTGYSLSGCETTESITVNVIPELIANAGNDIAICSGDSVTLSASGGTNYSWNTGETTQSILVSPTATSTYTVTVTQGEQEDTDDVTVYVEPIPEVVIANGDSVEILNGDFVTLSASGADTYEWSNGAAQPNIAVSPSVTTTYAVKGYVNNCFDEKQVTVNVLQPVVAHAGEDVTICIDETVALTATGGDEYVWNTGETTQTIEVSPSISTNYTVTVFNALDFDEASVTVDVDETCEGDGIPIDSSGFSFDIYPNPANDVLNVKLSGGALIISAVHIYDYTGKLIKTTKIENLDENVSATRQIDISSLQEGVYFVKLIDIKREVTRKLIVN